MFKEGLQARFINRLTPTLDPKGKSVCSGVENKVSDGPLYHFPSAQAQQEGQRIHPSGLALSIQAF